MVVVVVVTLVVPKPAAPSPPAPPAPNCKVPKSTVPPTGGRTLVPKSIAFLTVVVEIPCPIPTPSIAAKLVVPKSIASFTVVVLSEPAWATPGPCLTVTLRIDCLTTSGLTLTVSCLVSLTTDSLTISLWTCPLISCVASVSFLYIVGSTFFSNLSSTFLVSTLSTSFVTTFLILFWNTG